MRGRRSAARASCTAAGGLSVANNGLRCVAPDGGAEHLTRRRGLYEMTGVRAVAGAMRSADAAPDASGERLIYLVFLLLLLAALFLPQYWVQHVLARYNRKPEDNFPGTGGELARHLLTRFGLDTVGVERTDMGDHYDPNDRCVRLTPDKYDGRTLTAITVAAHECGHALQHAGSERLFMLRSRLAVSAVWAARVGSFLILLAPMLGLLSRAPSPALISVLGGFLVMGVGVLVQLVTLPVELDASFRKALPLLEAGYLERDQVPAARRILRAAAWTYVAASLASLLNFWRWLAILRR